MVLVLLVTKLRRSSAQGGERVCAVLPFMGRHQAGCFEDGGVDAPQQVACATTCCDTTHAAGWPCTCSAVVVVGQGFTVAQPYWFTHVLAALPPPAPVEPGRLCQGWWLQ